MMNHPILYILSWSLCLIIAVTLFLRKEHFRANISDYLAFLFVPWKIATFIISGLGITIAAPYSSDPTWDYLDSIVMSALTFFTSPWAVGAVFRAFKTKAKRSDIFIALCLMLFTSSWFYDAYILLRDGVYPATWLQNLIISPTFYIAAGLFWNLEHHPERGIIFSFQRHTWYHENSKTSFKKLIWTAIPLMAFAIYSVAWFVMTK